MYDGIYLGVSVCLFIAALSILSVIGEAVSHAVKVYKKRKGGIKR